MRFTLETPSPLLEPHLLYANLQFESPHLGKDWSQLRRWLSSVNFPFWKEQRLRNYLQEHQEEFRRCLGWVTEGAWVLFSDDEEPVSDQNYFEMESKWIDKSEAKFLQLHGLTHCSIRVAFRNHKGSSFSGIKLAPSQMKDPLDPICWHLLQEIQHHGTVGFRKCRYEFCFKFFKPKTKRKQYCSDICRAKEYAEIKTLEEKREYMRGYRADKKRRSKTTKIRIELDRPVFIGQKP